MTRDEALIAAFADELRSRRAALRLSQEELAHRAGVNRTYIAKLELARNQPTLTAYSTPWRTRFHADGGQCSSMMADTVPR